MSRHLPFCWGRWSKWEKKQADYKKYPNFNTPYGYWLWSEKPLEPIIVTEFWQERVCQKCGKIQQKWMEN